MGWYGSVQAQEISSKFNAAKVILPSTQYTPGQPYKAQVYVVNTGRTYSDEYYNKVWGVPPTDGNGREWYVPDYSLTSGDGIDWTEQQAPFSSDEIYKNQRSYRWTTLDIMGEIYMRRTFTLTEKVAEDIFLACGHDDAPAEWYINGVKVHEVSDGWNNDEYVLLTDEQKALIHTDGTPNVLAAHIHQNWGGSFADCGLYRADMTISDTFLPTLAKGPWSCKYYWLNYNEDIAVAESQQWYALAEDESDWIEGVGPFSNSNDQFLTTEWGSQVRPLLVRRHFNVSAAELPHFIAGNVTLKCSYDENPKVYLNGTLIWSANGWNDNDYAEYQLSEAHRQLLREGDNVLAVSLMQGGGGGHIDYGLEAVAPYTPSSIQPTVRPKEAPKNAAVFTIDGRYVGKDTRSLAPGMYIVGGKKFVKK